MTNNGYGTIYSWASSNNKYFVRNGPISSHTITLRGKRDNKNKEKKITEAEINNTAPLEGIRSKASRESSHMLQVYAFT